MSVCVYVCSSAEVSRNKRQKSGKKEREREREGKSSNSRAAVLSISVKHLSSGSGSGSHLNPKKKMLLICDACKERKKERGLLLRLRDTKGAKVI